MELRDITPQEEKLVKFLRHVGWGEVKLRVYEGQPVLIYEAIRTHRLAQPEHKSQRKKAYGHQRTRVWRAQ